MIPFKKEIVAFLWLVKAHDTKVKYIIYEQIDIFTSFPTKPCSLSLYKFMK